jgi:predicted house-cleaning noncanonical NTP pyrophosphatase (MazG superfamily)
MGYERTKRKTYNKLVRDNIPEIIEKDGMVAKTRILSREEYKIELRKKLEEEVQEYLDNPCLDELADIKEVIEALSYFHGNKSRLERRRASKALNRGGFRQGIFLIETRPKTVVD